MSKIIEEVSKYMEPIAAEHGVELVDVEFLKEGPDYYLRIYIDKENGVTIDDCVNVSRAIEVILDEKDIIKQKYILEVSSPGIDRVLKKDKDFERYKGRLIDIKLYKPINHNKYLQGILIAKTPDKLIIEDNNHKQIELDTKDIALVRLAVVF